MFKSLFDKGYRNKVGNAKSGKWSRANLTLDSLESREVLSATWVGDPGLTKQTAYEITDTTLTYAGSISGHGKADVDLFAVQLKKGQKPVVNLTDYFNMDTRSKVRNPNSFWGQIRIFSPEGKQLSIGYHQNATNTYYISMNKGVNKDGTYYIGISARGNESYDINTGSGAQKPSFHNYLKGRYLLNVDIVGQPKARDTSLPAQLDSQSVVGTQGNDQIIIRNAGSTEEFEILVNNQIVGTGTWLDTSDLTIDGGAGNDTIMVQAHGYAGLTSIRLIGGDGNDTIYGGEGDDRIEAGAGDDIVHGYAGIDFIYGGLGNDQLHGYEGNDLILGGDGDDLIGGGLGNDTLYGQDGNDRVFGHEGNDGVFGGSGDDWLEGNEGNDSLGNDAIFGEPGNDMLQGGTGNDYLFGGDGNDVLWGGSSTDVWSVDGDDRMEGGAGRDIMMGQAGNDSMFGGSENDELYGGYGNDYLDGQQGDDIVFGEFGDDEVRGGNGSDWVTGDEGNDRLFGDEGDDMLNGQIGNDVLSGGAGNDRLYGGSGADEVYGDDGDDTLYGEDGNDFLAGFGGNDVIYGQQGNDTLRGGLADDSLYGGDGVDSMSGGEGNDYLQGDEGADDMWGDSGNDFLVGGNGNDVLRGGDGDDQIMGGAGIDIHLGGAGNDTIVCLDGVVGDVAQAGTGRDIVWADSAGDVISEAEVTHRVVSFINGADVTFDGDRISDPEGEVYRNFANQKLFPTLGPGPEDCIQGGVGNCPVVAQLAAVAHQNPTVISDRMVSFGDGTYGLKLGDDYYRVDADLPVTNQNTLKYANAGREGALWGAIYEKALIAYRLRNFPTWADNTYPSLIGADGSDVLRSLGHPERYSRHYPEEYGSLLGFLNEVGRQFDLRNNVSVGVRVTSNVPLVGSHAYTVMAVQRDNSGAIQTITLRNPWGVDGISNGSDLNDGLVTVSASQFMNAIYEADWGRVN